MNDPRILAELREFQPFARLGEDDLLILASRAVFDRAPRGAVLFEQGSDDDDYYCLVGGAVELEAADGRTHRIDAGTERAAQPLSRLRPRQYTARAVTSVEVLRIDGAGLGDIAGAMSREDEYVVEEMLSDDEARSDRAAIYATQLGERALKLPTLPQVAVETSRLIESDEADVDAVARIVMHDPSITAKLVRAANSPLYYGREPIQTCERAIVRLGLRTTRQLVLAFAMRDLFDTDAAALRARMADLWVHSTEVAAIASVLARELRTFDPDEAQLAGLIHDIGVVPVLGYVAERDELLAEPATVDFLQEDLKAEIGERLLESWNFPVQLVVAAREAEHWWRDGAGEAELADLVIVAQLLSFFGKSVREDVPPLVRLPAFTRLTAGRLDAEATMAVLTRASERIAEIQAILR